MRTLGIILLALLAALSGGCSITLFLASTMDPEGGTLILGIFLLAICVVLIQMLRVMYRDAKAELPPPPAPQEPGKPPEGRW